MNIGQLLSYLQSERSRIPIAIEALTQLDSSTPAKRPGRPPALLLLPSSKEADNEQQQLAPKSLQLRELAGQAKKSR